MDPHNDVESCEAAAESATATTVWSCKMRVPIWRYMMEGYQTRRTR